MSIKKRLMEFSLVAGFFILAIGSTAYWVTHQLSATVGQTENSMLALRNHLQADMMHDALRGDLLSALLAGGKKDLSARPEVEKDLNEHIAEFKEALHNNELLPQPKEISEALVKVRPKLEDYIGLTRKTLALAFDDPAAAELQMPKFTESFGLLETEMSNLSDLIETNVKAAKVASDHTSKLSAQVIVGLTAIALVLIGGYAVMTSKAILGAVGAEPETVKKLASAIERGQLSHVVTLRSGDVDSIMATLDKMARSLHGTISGVRQAAETVAETSTELSHSSVDLAAHIDRQASSLQETASSMVMLTSTVKQNADSAKRANDLALSASTVASKGGAVVSQVVERMSSINQSAKKIADIIGVIDSIAFQTNILALNAAVEAARAGEQGRGFAVVASEVRTLAQRSAGAAKEIKSLITDSVEQVNVGSRLVDEAGTRMEEIVNSIQHVTEIVSQITQASQVQIADIETVNGAIVQMDQGTRDNSVLVENAAQSASALHGHAQDLSTLVSTFNLEATSAHAPG